MDAMQKRDAPPGGNHLFPGVREAAPESKALSAVGHGRAIRAAGRMKMIAAMTANAAATSTVLTTVRRGWGHMPFFTCSIDNDKEDATGRKQIAGF